MLSSRAFRLTVMPLFLFAALFPVLAIDVAARLMAGASYQERGNLVLLLFYELTRALRTLLGLALVVLLLVRSADRREARALVLFLLFGLVGYAMAFGGSGYVGPFQEVLVRTLEAMGATKELLFIVFGYPLWALWLALAALVRFSVLFPQPLRAEALAASGAGDRAGLMRSVPGAGVDIGESARRLVRAALSGGWLAAGPVWAMGIAGSLASIALRESGVSELLWLPFMIGVGMVITALRAGYTVGGELERRRIRWVGLGSLAALGFVALAGIVGALGGSEPIAIAVFVLMTLAPGSFLLGLGIAALSGQRAGGESAGTASTVGASA